ncbi:MAG: dihydrolipoamide acetyltransferase family protein [Dehalococcoidia bacterium]
MADFLMPSLGADMDAGRLVEWRVRPGDQVERGDIIATIETDKAAIDVEVWESGTVEALLVEEGTRVPVGTPLARIAAAALSAAGPEAPDQAQPVETSAAAPVEPPTTPREATAPPRPAPPEAVPQPAAAEAPSRERLRVTPLARVRAEELGVNLAGVRGTGPDGAITQADVERAGEGEPAAAISPSEAGPPAAAIEEPSETAAAETGATVGEQTEPRAATLRRAIAAAMSLSNRDIPHYYLSMAVDLSSTLAWLERTNQQRGVAERVLPSALFVRAVALATHEVPEMNGHYLDGQFRAAERAHVGFAVAVPGGGLIAPAILEADRKSLVEVMTALRELVSRARAGTLRSSELASPTITISSLGERGGIDTVYGIVNPPQVALVGVGSIVERPWAEGGMVGARRQVTLSLSGDHRVSDGHRGALFLAAIDRLLRDPERL